MNHVKSSFDQAQKYRSKRKFNDSNEHLKISKIIIDELKKRNFQDTADLENKYNSE